MLDAPRQNWALYESMSHAADAAWIRSLTPSDRFALYADLFNLVWEGRRSLPMSERLDQARWHEKSATRQRLAGAFAQWDAWRHERTLANHPG